MPNKYNKPGLRSTEDQNGGHGVILCDVGPEDQGLPGRVRLKLDFLGLHARTYLQPHRNGDFGNVCLSTGQH